MTGRFFRTRETFILPVLLVAAALLAVMVGALAIADDGAAPVPTGEAQRLGGGAEQQAALADGVIAKEEYTEAFQRTLACLDDAGISYTVSNDPGGNPRYSAGPFASKADLDAAKPVMDGCYVEHLRGMDVARATAGR